MTRERLPKILFLLGVLLLGLVLVFDGCDMLKGSLFGLNNIYYISLIVSIIGLVGVVLALKESLTKWVVLNSFLIANLLFLLLVREVQYSFFTGSFLK